MDKTLIEMQHAILLRIITITKTATIIIWLIEDTQFMRTTIFNKATDYETDVNIETTGQHLFLESTPNHLISPRLPVLN